jgi:hypothetical protein
VRNVSAICRPDRYGPATRERTGLEHRRLYKDAARIIDRARIFVLCHVTPQPRGFFDGELMGLRNTPLDFTYIASTGL